MCSVLSFVPRFKIWRNRSEDCGIGTHPGGLLSGKEAEISDDAVKITDSLYFKHFSSFLFHAYIFETTLPLDDTSLVSTARGIETARNKWQDSPNIKTIASD